MILRSLKNTFNNTHILKINKNYKFKNYKSKKYIKKYELILANDVSNDFCNDSYDYTYLYCILVKYNNFKWLIKWGETSRTLQTRIKELIPKYVGKTYNSKNDIIIIPLALCKTGNSRKLESEFKHLVSDYIDVKNSLIDGSDLIEQSEKLYFINNKFIEFCGEKDLEYWKTENCIINQDNTILYDGEYV